MADLDSNQKAAVERLPRTPLIRAVRSLFELQERVVASAPNSVEVIVAGGAAVHYWTRSRVTVAVDCEFLSKVMLVNDQLIYEGDDSEKKILYFDRTYSPTLGPLHEDYRDRAVRVPDFEPGGKLRVSVLAPIDLAISKLGRFQDHDKEDIKALAKLGVVDASRFKELATQTVDYYVGDKGMLPFNLADAVRIIEKYSPKYGEAWK